MDVRMMLQGLAPGVEDQGHAELGTEMPGIGRDGGERLGGGAEQDRVDSGLDLVGAAAGVALPSGDGEQSRPLMRR